MSIEMKYPGHSNCLTEVILFPEGGGGHIRVICSCCHWRQYTHVAYITMWPVWIIKLVICHDASGSYSRYSGGVVMMLLDPCAAKLFASIFRHLMLKLLTQFPASNDEKYYIYKNRHPQYWFIGLTKHLLKNILSSVVIFFWSKPSLKPYIHGPSMTRVNGTTRIYHIMGLVGQGLTVLPHNEKKITQFYKIYRYNISN